MNTFEHVHSSVFRSLICVFYVFHIEFAIFLTNRLLKRVLDNCPKHDACSLSFIINSVYYVLSMSYIALPHNISPSLTLLFLCHYLLQIPCDVFRHTLITVQTCFIEPLPQQSSSSSSPHDHHHHSLLILTPRPSPLVTVIADQPRHQRLNIVRTTDNLVLEHNFAVDSK